MDTISLDLRGQRVILAAHPITRRQFRVYLAAVGKPIPASLVKGEGAAASVTYVSQVAAAEYCRWLSAMEGPHYRLPTMAELHELANEITEQRTGIEVWPRMCQPHPELRDGIKPTYLCEWTWETGALPQLGSFALAHVLGSVFYRPWARSGGNACRVQAHLSASEGYSFVTFRVAWNP